MSCSLFIKDLLWSCLWLTQLTVTKRNRKVQSQKKKIGGQGVCFMLAAVISFQWSYISTGRDRNAHYIEIIVLNIILIPSWKDNVSDLRMFCYGDKSHKLQCFSGVASLSLKTWQQTVSLCLFLYQLLCKVLPKVLSFFCQRVWHFCEVNLWIRFIFR